MQEMRFVVSGQTGSIMLQQTAYKEYLMQETRFVVSGQTGSIMWQQTAYKEYRTFMQETRFAVSGQTGSIMWQQTAYKEYRYLYAGDEIRCVRADRIDYVAADRVQGILLALNYLHALLYKKGIKL
jgi:hypothetical protein